MLCIYHVIGILILIHRYHHLNNHVICCHRMRIFGRRLLLLFLFFVLCGYFPVIHQLVLFMRGHLQSFDLHRSRHCQMNRRLSDPSHIPFGVHLIRQLLVFQLDIQRRSVIAFGVMLQELLDQITQLSEHEMIRIVIRSTVAFGQQRLDHFLLIHVQIDVFGRLRTAVQTVDSVQIPHRFIHVIHVVASRRHLLQPRHAH
mmetsp:Transcript_47269/g.75756  ORF Transcript_47269/g.75756 Transcript_47269/m.75756 type:complete len:200 (-) Transcript_47269:541-1140(-)